MSEAPSAPGAMRNGRGRSESESPLFGALDLGTNNCRLLIATPAGRSFRVVEAYSRIVRLASTSPWVLLGSGDLLRVQLMNRARRPVKS